MKAELVLLHLRNRGQQLKEVFLRGHGTIFRARDYAIREIGEAMLLDGALPSEINKATLYALEHPEEVKKSQPDSTALTYDALCEYLMLEGADRLTAKDTLAQVRKELALVAQPPLLLNNRTVSLEDYREY